MKKRNIFLHALLACSLVCSPMMATGSEASSSWWSWAKSTVASAAQAVGLVSSTEQKQDNAVHQEQPKDCPVLKAANTLIDSGDTHAQSADAAREDRPLIQNEQGLYVECPLVKKLPVVGKWSVIGAKGPITTQAALFSFAVAGLLFWASGSEACKSLPVSESVQSMLHGLACAYPAYATMKGCVFLGHEIPSYPSRMLAALSNRSEASALIERPEKVSNLAIDLKKMPAKTRLAFLDQATQYCEHQIAQVQKELATNEHLRQAGQELSIGCKLTDWIPGLGKNLTITFRGPLALSNAVRAFLIAGGLYVAARQFCDAEAAVTDVVTEPSLISALTETIVKPLAESFVEQAHVLAGMLLCYGSVCVAHDAVKAAQAEPEDSQQAIVATPVKMIVAGSFVTGATLAACGASAVCMPGVATAGIAAMAGASCMPSWLLSARTEQIKKVLATKPTA